MNRRPKSPRAHAPAATTSGPQRFRRNWRPLATLAAIMTALYAAPSGARAAASFQLAGKWICTSTPNQLPAMHGLPAGKLYQRIAYTADADGRWASNGISDFVAHNGRDRYRMRTSAQGHSTSNANLVQERIRQFRILQPFDKSSAFATRHGPTINAVLLAAVQKHPGSLYSLVSVTTSAYQLQALDAAGKPGRIVISCTRAGVAAR